MERTLEVEWVLVLQLGSVLEGWKKMPGVGT